MIAHCNVMGAVVSVGRTFSSVVRILGVNICRLQFQFESTESFTDFVFEHALSQAALNTLGM